MIIEELFTVVNATGRYGYQVVLEIHFWSHEEVSAPLAGTSSGGFFLLDICSKVSCNISTNDDDDDDDWTCKLTVCRGH